MKKFLGIMALSAVATVGISASHAQGLMGAAAGTKFEGAASLGGKQVPLPDGVWELAYSDTIRPRSLDIGVAVLVQKSGGKDVGFIMARTNLQPTGGRGWNRPRHCDRKNVHHNGSDRNYNREDADCWIVNHFVAQNRMRNSVMEKFRDLVRLNAGTSTLVNNWYWKNDYRDFILVSYYLNPTAFGFPPDRDKRGGDSDWHAAAIGDGSPRKKFVDAAIKFGAVFRGAVGRGFHGKLGSGASGLKFSFQQ